MVLCLTIRRLNAIFLFQDYVYDELVTQFLSSSIIPPDTHKIVVVVGTAWWRRTPLHLSLFLGIATQCRMNGADKGVSGDFSTYSGTHCDFLWQNKCHGTGYHHQNSCGSWNDTGSFLEPPPISTSPH